MRTTATDANLQNFDGEEEAEEQLVSLEEAPAHVHVYRPREAVVEALQPPFQVRRRRRLSDGLAEQRAEPG